MVYEILNSIEGVSCNEVMGAMYAFPRIELPKKAIEKAEVSTLFSCLEFQHTTLNGPLSLRIVQENTSVVSHLVCTPTIRFTTPYHAIYHASILLICLVLFRFILKRCILFS